MGIGTRDTDNDSWDDDEDNCKDDPNPRQEDADDDDVGDACEEGAAPGVFPSQPPSVPTCAPVFPGIRPGSFGTGTPEDWPLVEQTAVEAVELDFTENYYDFVVVCHYDPPPRSRRLLLHLPGHPQVAAVRPCTVRRPAT